MYTEIESYRERSRNAKCVCVSFREGADAGVFDFFTKKHIKHIK
jgi:hypothetical protein